MNNIFQILFEKSIPSDSTLCCRNLKLDKTQENQWFSSTTSCCIDFEMNQIFFYQI